LVPHIITVRNEIPGENILARTFFQTVISRGTYFIARISTGSLFFQQLILKKYGSSKFPWK
jgi:hypothetical protein